MATSKESPPSKRARTNDKKDEQILDPIATDVFEKTNDWASAYKEATPYSHGIIPGFCKEGFLGEFQVYSCNRSPSMHELINHNFNLVCFRGSIG